MAKVIDASEVRGGRRGRTPNTNPAILEALSGLKMGQAVKFAKSDGIPVTEANSTERQTVRANLVSHWKQAGHITVVDGTEISGHKASVQFDPADGLPAVKFGKGVGTDADEDGDES